MSEQENRTTLKCFIEAFKRRDFNALNDLVHDNYVEEYPQLLIRVPISEMGAASTVPANPNQSCVLTPEVLAGPPSPLP